MSARAMLVAMIAGTAVVIRALPAPLEPPAAPPRPMHGVPWLTPEAAAQIIGPDGTLGPLFAGVVLGGAEPPAEIRTRIAELAKANDVSIELEIVDGDVAAIRFDVTFRGGVGYEGADVLALRLRRPTTSSCCGCTPGWLDDWTLAAGDDVQMRARVRVNRVTVRWEKTATLRDLLARADGLIGANPHEVAAAAGDRWTELGSRHYLLEHPYPFTTSTDYAHPVALRDRADFGLQVFTERGRIVEVTIPLRALDGATERAIPAALRARWGRPRVAQDSWTWRTRERVITAELGAWPATIRIRARG